MNVHLIVREPFADYRKGDHIDDADAVKAILEGGNRHHVIAINPVLPAPNASADW